MHNVLMQRPGFVPHFEKKVPATTLIATTPSFQSVMAKRLTGRRIRSTPFLTIARNHSKPGYLHYIMAIRVANIHFMWSRSMLSCKIFSYLNCVLVSTKFPQTRFKFKYQMVTIDTQKKRQNRPWYPTL